MIFLINLSLRLPFDDDHQEWSTLILMIHSHPHPKPLRALSLRLLPIFNKKQEVSCQKVILAIMMTA